MQSIKLNNHFSVKFANNLFILYYKNIPQIKTANKYEMKKIISKLITVKSEIN